MPNNDEHAQLLRELSDLREEHAHLCRRLGVLDEVLADYATTNKAFRLALARAHGACQVSR